MSKFHLASSLPPPLVEWYLSTNTENIPLRKKSFKQGMTMAEKVGVKEKAKPTRLGSRYPQLRIYYGLDTASYILFDIRYSSLDDAHGIYAAAAS